MKKAILIAAAALVVLAAAPAMWLLLDDGGDRRSAALVVPAPTAEAIGTLTINNSVLGPITAPVQSFTLAVMRSVDLATGQISGKVTRQPLQIVKPIDSASPLLFKMGVSNSAGATATLELKTPGDRETKPVVYATYHFTNVTLSSWSDSESETIELRYATMTPDVKGAPSAPAAAVIGQMTAPGLSATPIPITKFESGFTVPSDAATGQASGKRAHKLLIGRALDGSVAQVWQKLTTLAALGTVTVELQRGGATYATYIFTGTSVSAAEDLGASGDSATQEMKFIFQTVEVQVGGKIAQDSLVAAS